MKPDPHDIDDVIKRHLPSAPAQQMEFDGARVLHRLRLGTGDSGLGTGDSGLGTGDSGLGTGDWGLGRAALLSAAAVLIAVAIGTAILWTPRDPIALVEAVDGSLYRAVEGPSETVSIGDALEADETVRTNGGAGAMLALADGSRVEMRSQSELSLARVDDGLQVRLTSGSIIVNAAEQRAGHLYVLTRDMTVSVVGTVFLVNAADDGSRVGVIEGEVRVREGAIETTLRPGEQTSTSPTLATRPLAEAIAWSRHADAHRAILAAFAKGIADTAGALDPLTDAPPSLQAAPGQSAGAAASPRFEEASIRECDPDNLPPPPPGARGGGANSFQMTPGRTYALCLTLATLVRTAYGYAPMDLEVMNSGENASRRGPGMRFDAVYGLGVEDGRRVRGGPDWVRSERYTIEAVADGPADAMTMRGPMLRALLERRFQLKVHIESEQVDAYALTVADGGLKIKAMQEGDCNRDGLTDAIRAERAMLWDARGPVLIAEAARLGIKPTCGTVYGDWNGPNMRTDHIAQTPGSVAGALSAAMDVRVVDRTGITERFVFTWEFGPDESTPGYLRDAGSERTGSRRPGFDGALSLPKAPPVLTVIEQQLGLKLEPIRLPREFIVIDHVEKPTPN